jgi:hypothetical protein
MRPIEGCEKQELADLKYRLLGIIRHRKVMIVCRETFERRMRRRLLVHI